MKSSVYNCPQDQSYFDHYCILITRLNMFAWGKHCLFEYCCLIVYSWHWEWVNLREHDDDNDEETINLQHLSQYLYLVPLEERCHRIYFTRYQLLFKSLTVVALDRQYRLQSTQRPFVLIPNSTSYTLTGKK